MLIRTVLILLSLWVAPAYAADHVAVNETIWPSQNDIAQTPGDGKKLLENQWAKQSSAFRPNNYSMTGLTVPATSVNLNISISEGTAYIAGRHITIPAGTSVTAAASNTNYVFLKLTRDGASLGTGVSFTVNTTNIPPADSTGIATLTAGVSTITSTLDKRILPTTTHVLTSGSTWNVPAGITQIYVELYGIGGGGGGGAGDTGNGSNGNVGGNVVFDNFQALGGAGGRRGISAGATGIQGAAHGSGTDAPIVIVGGGHPGGSGGGGAIGKDGGGNGGHGGYVAGAMAVTPGADIAYSLDTLGTSGYGGGGGGGTTYLGAAGQHATAPGKIVIHY